MGEEEVVVEKNKEGNENMATKPKTRSPLIRKGVRVYKACGLGELVRRLRNIASRKESWCIVSFTVTGEVFKINGGGEIKQCY